MNHMINKGDIIQVKNRFRMPYSDNQNLISSLSQVLRQQDLSRKQEQHVASKGTVNQEALKRQSNQRIIKINKRNLNLKHPEQPSQK